MTELRWYAVRCSSTPNKIIGFMTLPKEVDGRSDIVIDTTEAIRVRRAKGATTTEFAIVADGRPLEYWMQFPGFVPCS